jgi:CRISPR-associated protein Cas5d
MNPIITESKGIRPINYHDQERNRLSYYTYLKDVRYQVQAHFIFNPYRDDLSADRNEQKHYCIAQRALSRGGRRDIFLGTRECQGYVEPRSFGSDVGFYDDIPQIDWGIMVHGINYPDETEQHIYATRLWHVTMQQGIIRFIPPEQCTLIYPWGTRTIRPKHFDMSFIEPVDRLYHRIVEKESAQ